MEEDWWKVIHVGGGPEGDSSVDSSIGECRPSSDPEGVKEFRVKLWRQYIRLNLWGQLV